jgi:PAS domain-containing protein
MIAASGALSGSYDYSEVANSVLIAMVASYAALDLAARVTAAKGGIRLAWLSGGAIAMGLGIWAMHFKGMLAFHLPVPVAYHWPTVLASLLLAFLASAVALYVASRQKMGPVAGLDRQHIYGRGHRRHALHRHGRNETARRHPFFCPSGDVFHLARNLVFSNRVADGVRSTRGDQMECSAEAGQRHADGSRCLRDALHWNGCRKFHTRFASGPFPRREHSPLGDSAVAIAALIMVLAAVTTSSVDRRQSEHRLRLVIDTLPAMVWSKSPDGCADFVNQRFREYTGLSVEEGLGWGWMRNAFHPEDRAEEEWRAAFAAGQPFEKEARLRRAAPWTKEVRCWVCFPIRTTRVTRSICATETFWFCTLTRRSKLRIKQENNTRRRGWQRLRVCTRNRVLRNW